MNLVAYGWGRKFLREGDEILISEMEHHSNIVPWQFAAQATGAVLRYIPLTDDGMLDLSELGSLLTERTKILRVTGMSNVLGTITPLRQLIDAAHAVGAVVAVDGAQLVPHLRWTWRELDVRLPRDLAGTRCSARRRRAGLRQGASSSRRWTRCSAGAR